MGTDETVCCTNGGFEDGTFDGFSLSYGRINDMPSSGLDNSQSQPGQAILPSASFMDPLLPNLPLSQANGIYLARLGNDLADARFNKLSKSFIVDECNRNFLTNYLPVFQDAGHDPAEQPSFTITLSLVGGGVIATDKVVADVNNPFFSTEFCPEGSSDDECILIRGWTCFEFDLSAYIGQEVVVEYEVRDCSLGGHFGYVYLDDVCGNNSQPVPILEGFEANLCTGSNLVIDYSRSKQYDQIGLTIQTIGASPFSIYNFPLQPTPLVTTLDLQEAYSSMDCGSEYDVILQLVNSCGGMATATKRVKYHCIDAPQLRYDDYYVCDRPHPLHEIRGTSVCATGCTYAWTPSAYLENSRISNPLIRTGSFVDALDRTYSVTAINAVGCKAEDDVSIYFRDAMITTTSVALNSCDQVVTLNLKFALPVSLADIKIMINNLPGYGQSGAPELIFKPKANQVSPSLEFDFGATIARGGWPIENVSHLQIRIEVEVEGAPCIFENPSVALLPNQLAYTSNTTAYPPTAFSPNGNGVNDVWSVYAPADHPYISGQLIIANRWGGILVDSDISANPERHQVDVSQLRWDGTFNNNPASQDVYAFVLTLQSYYDEIQYTGDITLFR